jgi:hypothetical protein
MKEKLSLQELKDACNLGQKIREDSWHESTDHSRHSHYTKTIEESAKEAVKELDISPEWGQLIYILNLQAWNDIQEVQIP